MAESVYNGFNNTNLNEVILFESDKVVYKLVRENGNVIMEIIGYGSSTRSIYCKDFIVREIEDMITEYDLKSKCLVRQIFFKSNNL